MPQTSPAAVLARAGPIQAGLPDRSRTPPARGALFATLLAILARVLVGPIPIDTGMPGPAADPGAKIAAPPGQVGNPQLPEARRRRVTARRDPFGGLRRDDGENGTGG